MLRLRNVVSFLHMRTIQYSGHVLDRSSLEARKGSLIVLGHDMIRLYQSVKIQRHPSSEPEYTRDLKE